MTVEASDADRDRAARPARIGARTTSDAYHAIVSRSRRASSISAPNPLSREDCWRRLLGGGRHVAVQRLRHLGGRAQGGRQAGRPRRPVHRLARHRARVRRRARDGLDLRRRDSWAGDRVAKRATRRSTGPRPNLDADAAVGDHRSGNEPSIKLAERLGFERVHEGVYRDEPIAWCCARPAWALI